jgi:hypothetical protein
MVGAGRLEKLLKVIGRLPRLALEVTVGRGDMFFIGVISFLVVVALITTSSNCDLLGAPLWPPLIVFGATIDTFASSLGQCPSTTSVGHLSIALDENGPDCLLTGGVLGGNVQQLLCGLQLIMAEFMCEGSATTVGPEHRDGVSIANLEEFVALPGEPPNVIPEGLA